MKKIISTILLLIMCLGLFAGCSSKSGLIKLDYTIEDKDAYFFMDREYALDASNVDTTEAELKKAESYLTDYVLEAAKNGDSAFDFLVDGASFAEDIKNWTVETEKTDDTDVKTDWTLTYTKDGNPITVTVYATLYKEYAIIEWTVWLTNTGSEKTGQITELNALKDTFAEDFAQSEIRLTTFEGSHESNDSFRAQTMLLEVDKSKSTNGTSGKPSVTWAPYMNLQWSNEEAEWGKEGVFISNGWSGQWATKVENTGEGVVVTAKQERLDTYLAPGESIRSPLITMLFWEKDLMRSQNLWRRWVYTVAMPQPDGEPIPPMMHGNTAAETGLTVWADTENQLEAIDRWMNYGLDIDAWQMDAGWYDMANNSTDWVDTGSWTPSIKRFNGTLKPIADRLDEYDLDFILWFEPERLTTNSYIFNEFKGTDYYMEALAGWHCFNFANDEAAAWLTNYICNTIDANGVDIYRQDCNLNDGASLMSYWKEYEEDGKMGYLENRYIINYLKYFDEILEHTGTFIDNCASGGKRLDLESTKRSVALWRDDKCYDPTLTQCQSWGINFFMPYSGQGTLSSDPYVFRSNMMQYTGMAYNQIDHLNDEDVEDCKKVIVEHKAYADYLTKDYYPLTPFDETEYCWMAWQYNDPETSSGLVQAFKRVGSDVGEQTYRLSGLDAKTKYVITDIDTNETVEMTGKELMTKGLTVTMVTGGAIGERDCKAFTYAPVEK